MNRGNMKKVEIIIACCCVIFLSACNNKPATEIYRLPETDTTILGTWRVAEDTDKTNFIIFQCPHDDFSFWLDKTHKVYTVNEVSELLAHHIHDTEEVIETLRSFNDTSKWDSSYVRACEIYKKIRDTCNVIRDLGHYFFPFYISKINGQDILNIHRRFFSRSSIVLKKPVKDDGKFKDLYHLRVLYRSPAGDTMVTALVGDSTLLHVTDSVAFCKKIKDNFNNPGFYSDTLHFYRINTYHSDGDSAFMKADTAWHMNPNKIFRGLVRRNYK